MFPDSVFRIDCPLSWGAWLLVQLQGASSCARSLQRRQLPPKGSHHHIATSADSTAGVSKTSSKPQQMHQKKERANIAERGPRSEGMICTRCGTVFPGAGAGAAWPLTHSPSPAIALTSRPASPAQLSGRHLSHFLANVPTNQSQEMLVKALGSQSPDLLEIPTEICPDKMIQSLGFTSEQNMWEEVGGCR